MVRFDLAKDVGVLNSFDNPRSEFVWERVFSRRKV